jgi:hypothetical protein
MPQSRGYSSGKVALELQGKPAGFLNSVEGGEAFGTVVALPANADGIAKKHIDHVEYEPITIVFGIGMADELYAWIAEVLDRKQSRRDGAIVFLSYDFTEIERLEWKSGLITQISFPAADGSTKDAAFIAVTITAELISMKPAARNAHTGFTTKTKKKNWMASNFRFSVGGLESASPKVKKVEALTVTQPLATDERGRRDPGVLQVSNVLVTVPLAFAQPWLDWVDDFLVKGNVEENAERTATLQFLDTSLKSVLFTVTLFHVGPVRARRQIAGGSIDVVAEVELELYCEFLAFMTGEETAGVPIAVPPASQATSPPASEPLSPAPAGVTDALVALLARGESGNDAQRTRRLLEAASLTRNPELVAARLKASAAADRPGATQQPRRAIGEALGERWATEHASLAELQQIALLENAEWTAIRLPDDHSLIAQLHQQGLVPPGGEGAIQLARDEFVEGIVSGAARVLRAASPHLG